LEALNVRNRSCLLPGVHHPVRVKSGRSSEVNAYNCRDPLSGGMRRIQAGKDTLH